MTQRQLDSAVADLTGESLRTIHHRGFGPHSFDANDDTPIFLLDCPCCGSQVLLASNADDLPELADCPACDTCFDFSNNEVYASSVDDLVPARDRRRVPA